HVAQLTQSLPKRVKLPVVTGSGPHTDEPDPRHPACRLRLTGERRGEEGEGAGDECASVHYSISWSARSRTAGGVVRLRALAVLRLMTSSNLVGCSTGRSAGLIPFRILSTWVAARRAKSLILAP